MQHSLWEGLSCQIYRHTVVCFFPYYSLNVYRIFYDVLLFNLDIGDFIFVFLSDCLRIYLFYPYSPKTRLISLIISVLLLFSISWLSNFIISLCFLVVDLICSSFKISNGRSIDNWFETFLFFQHKYFTL